MVKNHNFSLSFNLKQQQSQEVCKATKNEIKQYVFGHLDAYAVLFYTNLQIIKHTNSYINRILNITLYFILGFKKIQFIHVANE